MESRVMVMAGGTGGHVFPALAVAQELRERGMEVFWLGTATGFEAGVVPKAGFRSEWINVKGLRGSGIGRWLLAPFTITHAMLQALRVLRRNRPSVVLGMGGFVTGPGGPYVISGLSNGFYYIYAVIDLDNSSGPPDPGEPVGFYDPNHDDIPDSVYASVEILQTGIDIDIYDPLDVPTLNQWGMFFLALFFIGTGIWFIRRRKMAN